MDKKIAIVTGANSGIGKATSQQLVENDVQVIMACRNAERANAALEEIKKNTGKDNVEVMILDTSSQKSIRDFVDAFKAKYQELHLLINNAATFNLSEKVAEITDDGFEKTWATNHLGPFLLTHLLMDTLKASQPARVINIASMGLITYPFLKLDYERTTNPPKKFSVQKEYYHSKLAQVMYTYKLAQELEGTGVTANVIRVPNVRMPIQKLRDMGISNLQINIYKMKSKFAMSPENMAETYVKLGIDPEYRDLNGKYITEKMKTVKSNRFSMKPENWDTLWNASLDQLGL